MYNRLPNKNENITRNFINNFTRFRKCPLTFHQDGELCSESLKLKKNMIKTQIDFLIRKYEEEPINASNIQQSNLATKKPQSNTNSLKMLRDIAKSSINLQNLMPIPPNNDQ